MTKDQLVQEIADAIEDHGAYALTDDEAATLATGIADRLIETGAVEVES